MRVKNSLQFILVLLALLCMGAAQAKPAPWFWWVSKLNGERVCAQVMPEQGWMRADGPFTNAQCSPQRGALLRG